MHAVLSRVVPTDQGDYDMCSCDMFTYLMNYSLAYLILCLQYTAECNKLLSQFRLAEKAALGKTMTTE